MAQPIQIELNAPHRDDASGRDIRIAIFPPDAELICNVLEGRADDIIAPEIIWSMIRTVGHPKVRAAKDARRCAMPGCASWLPGCASPAHGALASLGQRASLRGYDNDY
jgi:hypothetical protein